MNKVLLTVGIVFGILTVAIGLSVIKNILISLLGAKVVFCLVFLGIGYYVYKYIIPEFTNTK